MKPALLISTSITALLGLSACNSFDLDSGRSQILKADQRVLLVKHGPNGPYGPNGTVVASNDGPAMISGTPYLGSAANPLVCAEPSPDAISSKALSAAISADVAGKAKGTATGSYSETAASIAARTAAVQVLRDIEYRACEALMNGVVGPQHYNQILSATAYTTIGLVAVDGLGQAKMAGQLSTSASPSTTDKAKDAKPGEDGAGAGAGAGKEKSGTGGTTATPGSGSASAGTSTQTNPADGSQKTAPAPGEMARALCLTTIASPAGVDARLRSTPLAGSSSSKPDYTDVKDLVETCMSGLAAKSEPAAGSAHPRTAEKAGRKTVAQKQ